LSPLFIEASVRAGLGDLNVPLGRFAYLTATDLGAERTKTTSRTTDAMLESATGDA